ncbi:MAG TPA: methyltransferase, FxLD system, partial [Streptosporangiaceae bacterium]|nr:methyltransferase, FxLD system [Streptosporangiaceae bacterium]
EGAFRRLPRHLFLPGVPLSDAYAPKVVVTKRGHDGTAVSSASHPNLVAAMLEQLEVRPGHRILEIGTATGINAGLLAELAGPRGTVATIEIDPGLAEGARRALTAAGYGNVEVICGDGAAGHAAGAPYDRIIVTAGAWDIPGAWWDQLGPAGRLVVPLRLHSSDLTRCIAFDRNRPDQMTSASARMCGFVPLTGACSATGRTVQLAGGGTVSVDPADTGISALSQALSYPPVRAWTGIIADFDPAEHLDLWLATATPGFARIAESDQARQSGSVTPARRWGGAALHDGAGTLVYLTLRPVSDAADELGVTAHGPASCSLVSRTISLLHRWHRDNPGEPVITASPAGSPERSMPGGARIHRPATTFTITW